MTETPTCYDRWCKNKGRYRVPHFVNEDGTDGPLIDVCKTHARIFEESNQKDRDRQALHARLDYLDDVLIPSMVEVFERKAGITLSNVSKEQSGRRVGLDVEDVTKILEWMTR